MCGIYTTLAQSGGESFAELQEAGWATFHLIAYIELWARP
jgi:hypothetical protein